MKKKTQVYYRYIESVTIKSDKYKLFEFFDPNIDQNESIEIIAKKIVDNYGCFIVVGNKFGGYQFKESKMKLEEKTSDTNIDTGLKHVGGTGGSFQKK